MTRRAVPLCFGLSAGAFYGFYLLAYSELGPKIPIIYVIISAISVLIAIPTREGIRKRAELFFAGFLLGGLLCFGKYSLRVRPLERLDGKEVSVFGRVSEVSGGDRMRIVVSGSVDGNKGKILLYSNGGNFEPGDEIEAVAKVEAIKSYLNFDGRSQYYPDGIFLQGNIEKTLSVKKNKNLFYAIRKYSETVSESLRESVPGETGELLAAMISGDVGAISDGLRLKLNRSGAGHIAAVSGLHVSIVAAAVFFVMKKLRAPKKASAFAAEFAALVFLIFSGMRISAIRAFVMLSFVLFADIFHRKPDGLNTISAAAGIMIIFSPFSAADASFQLSFAGVFGAAVISKSLIKEFDIESEILKGLVTSLSASFASAPFVLLHFNELSLIGPLVNVFAIPLCSAALTVGMVFVLSGCIFSPAAVLAGIILEPVTAVCGKLGKLRFAYIPKGNNAVFIAFFAAAALAAAIYIISKNVRKTAFLGIFSVCMIIFANGVFSALPRGNFRLIAINSGREKAAAIISRGSMAVIDYEGYSARTAEEIAESYGAIINAAIIYKRAPSAEASYLSAAQSSGNVFTVGESPSVPGSEIGIGDIKIKLYESGAKITLTNGAAVIGFGEYIKSDDPENNEPDIRITLLDGVSVVGDNEIKEYVGRFYKSYNLAI